MSNLRRQGDWELDLGWVRRGLLDKIPRGRDSGAPVYRVTNIN